MDEKQPKALYYLFLTEMWERFGFYTMATLMVLYLSSKLGMGDDEAFLTFGAYTSFAYLTPVAGGIVADRLLGARRSIILGAAMMSSGYFLLQIESVPVMFAALGVLVVGNGLFKPNVGALLGQFYGKDDPRRDRGFTIFYMGINIGGLVAAVVAGIVATKYGYGLAFAMAGAGKLISLATFLLARKHLRDHGLMPETSPLKIGGSRFTSTMAVLVCGIVALIGVAAFLIDHGVLDGRVLAVAGVAVTGYFLYEVLKEKPAHRPRLYAFVILLLFAVVFWAVYQQSSTSVVLYTKRDVDLGLFGFDVPPSDMISLNPMFILLLAPIFSYVWKRMTEAGHDVPIPLKFTFGLLFMGLAFMVLRLGGLASSGEEKVGLYWMVLFYLLFTMGELSVSPIGLSMATALAPQRLAGYAMGMWLLSVAAANYIGGLIAGIANIPAGTSADEGRHIYEQAFADFGWIGTGHGTHTIGPGAVPATDDPGMSLHTLVAPICSRLRWR